VLAVITEPFTHGAASERSNILQRSSLRSSRSNNGDILHGISLLKGLDELGNGGTLLTNGNVDAVELLALVVAIVPALLVQDGVKSDGSLTGLTITDDKLTLATTDRHHGVDGFETGLHRLVDGTTGQDTRGLDLGTDPLSGLDRAFAIDGVAEGVDHTTEQSLADWNVDLFFRLVGVAYQQMLETYNLTGTLDSLAFLDQSIGTEKHNTDLTGFQVHAHALDTGCKPALVSLANRRAPAGV
jgi:hypothetical protein